MFYSRSKYFSIYTWSEAFRKIIDNKKLKDYVGLVQDMRTEIKESEINNIKSDSAISKIVNSEKNHCKETNKIHILDNTIVEVKNAEIDKHISESNKNYKESNAKNISDKETNHANILDDGNFEYESNSSNVSCLTNCSSIAISSNNSSTCPLSITKDYNTSTIPKKTCTKDATKLMKELQEIKKEVEEIKLELKINGAKKINNEFLHVTIQGIPHEVKNEDIINDLRSKYFSVDTVYRLGTKNDEITNDIVFQVPKNEDHIFYLSCCLGFEVYVKEYKDNFSFQNNCNFVKNSTDSFVQHPIYVLIKGIPIDISERDVLKDLRKKHFHPVAVYSMITDKHREEDQTVVVQVPGKEEHIYELSCLLGFPVLVEEVNKGHLNIAQCKKCLQFGHKRSACPGEKAEDVSDVDNPQCSADLPTLNVVIKGVPIEFNDEKVSNHLKGNGFSPIAVHRMVVNDELLPSYLVSIPQQEKIFWLTCFMGFAVKVELFLADLYDIDQCVNCHQFGHLKDLCQNKKLKKGLCNNDKTDFYFETCNKKEVNANKKEPKLAVLQNKSVVSTETQTEFSHLELADKLNELHVCFQDFIQSKKNMSEKSCCCKNESSIPTVDASTSTDDYFKQLRRLTQDVKSYRSGSLQFRNALGNYSQFILKFKDKSSFYVLQGFLKTEMSGVASTVVKAMITVLNSVISVMLDVPDLPGVTINTINEQLHFLQELEEIKETLDKNPEHFTQDYEKHFPELE